MSDSIFNALFGTVNPDAWPEAERAAFSKGYADFKKQASGAPLSILRPAFDPPVGYERAYGAGWERAQQDELGRKMASWPDV